ncbi:MAG TPA: hypothetical protein VNL72_00360 [Gammaproteobacteria bacterium]|nr:hypothetical protein [Gammaproteobacteria bacterium]
MHTSQLQLTFYDREDTLTLPVTSRESSHFMECVKKLAAGDRSVPSHYLLNLSDTHTALVAIKEVQTVYAVANGGTGHFAAPAGLDNDGAAFYLQRRRAPLLIALAPKGPFSDMITALITTHYDEPAVGCIMLADKASNPIFFRLDEVQFAIITRSLLAPGL